MKQKIRSFEFSAVALFFIFVFLLAMLGQKCHAQCWPEQPKQHGAFTYAAAGVTNGFFSAELHAGYRYKQAAVTIGYLSIPNNTQPALFQARAGVLLGNRWHVYGGAVRVVYNTDDKSRNYNTWTAGVQFHTLHYDRGTIYYHLNYSPGFISGGIGMSFNLLNENN